MQSVTTTQTEIQIVQIGVTQIETVATTITLTLPVVTNTVIQTVTTTVTPSTASSTSVPDWFILVIGLTLFLIALLVALIYRWRKSL
jgi:protein-S-isoprenylcysteine O-methyltransferase Ste14